MRAKGSRREKRQERKPKASDTYTGMMCDSVQIDEYKVA